MSLTLLLWPPAKVHPAVLVLVTCFPAIPTLTLNFRCVHSSRLFRTIFSIFSCSLSFASASGIQFPFLWKNFVLSTVRILQHPKDQLCLLELSTLDPAWVQRTLLLQRREQLLLSTFDTYPTVTVGVDSVARGLQGEALPTPSS